MFQANAITTTIVLIRTHFCFSDASTVATQLLAEGASLSRFRRELPPLKGEPRARAATAMPVCTSCLRTTRADVDRQHRRDGPWDASDTDVATALACFGGGPMAAALLLARLLDRVPDRAIMLSAAGLLAVALLCFALMVSTSVATEWIWRGLLPTWKRPPEGDLHILVCGQSEHAVPAVLPKAAKAKTAVINRMIICLLLLSHLDSSSKITLEPLATTDTIGG